MADKKLTIRVHGLAHQKFVNARVFAAKLSSLVRALSNTDKQKNGHRSLDFIITDLKVGSALAEIAERPASTKYIATHSSVGAVHRVLKAVYNGQARAVADDPAILPSLRRLSSGASQHFSHLEVYIDEDEATAVRIDDFFQKQVLVAEAAREASVEVAKKRLFVGTTHTTLDGVLKAIDLRGVVKQAKLILTAGGVEIDCVCNDVDVPDLGNSLDKRVRAIGIAHYDGTSALPVRVDIKEVQPIKSSPDLIRWKGAFQIPSEPEDW